MTLLLPLFLGSAALVGLPILLHLLRRRPRKVMPFPTLRFLGTSAQRDTRRRRILRWLTLLARCALILLVVLAFCRPFWPIERETTSRAVVVAIDNSYSMQAQGRLQSVEAWLRRHLKGLDAPDQLGVLVLHPVPTWVVPLGTDLAAGLDALEKLPVGYETTRYNAGLQLAAAALSLAPNERKQLLLAADQQHQGWVDVRFDKPLPAGIELLAAPPAPAPVKQAAITHLKAVRTAGGRLSVEAMVRNYSLAGHERTVAFHVNGAKAAEKKITLGAGMSHTINAEIAPPDASEALQVRVEMDPDSLPTDDVAYAALPRADDRRIHLSAQPTADVVDFLAGALAAARGGDLAAFQVEVLANGASLPSSGVAVLRGNAFFDAQGNAALEIFLQEGGSAWIICDGSPQQAACLKRLGITITPVRALAGSAGLKLRDLTLDHPLFAPFANHSLAPLLQPTFRRGFKIEGDAVEALGRWPDRGIAIAEVAVGGGRLLLTGFSDGRDDSNFPAQVGFVPFVHRAVSWLSESAAANPLSGQVGSPLLLPGEGVWKPVLSPLTAGPMDVDGSVTPTAPGLYEFIQKGVPRTYAVNLNTAESDLTPWPAPQEFAKLVSTESPRNAEARKLEARTEAIRDPRLADERFAWWWLIAAAALLVFVELALANRALP